jgi:hypothetical protein
MRSTRRRFYEWRCQWHDRFSNVWFWWIWGRTANKFVLSSLPTPEIWSVYARLDVEEETHLFGAPVSANDELQFLKGVQLVDFHSRSQFRRQGYTHAVLRGVDSSFRWKIGTLPAQPLPRASERVLESSNLTMATLCQDDIRFVRPWLEHYRRLGVDHFLIAYNGDLASMNEANLGLDVTLMEWAIPYSHRDRVKGKDHHFAQPAFLQFSLHWAKLNSVKWLMHMDIDEYVVLSEGDLHSVLNTDCDELSFENVWCATEHPISESGVFDEGQGYYLGQDDQGFRRGKTVKRVSAVEKINVHYSTAQPQEVGCFLHFSTLTNGGDVGMNSRPESWSWEGPFKLDEVFTQIRAIADQ